MISFSCKEQVMEYFDLLEDQIRRDFGVGLHLLFIDREATLKNLDDLDKKLERDLDHLYLQRDRELRKFTEVE